MGRIERRLQLNDTGSSKRLSEFPISSSNESEASSEPSSELRQLFDKKDYQGAIELLSRSIRSDSSNFSLYIGRAICAFGKMNIAGAQEDALKAVELNPKWPKNNPTKEGWIKKGGHINRNKKKRYFILQSLFLFYYKSKEDSAPQGVIPIYRSSILQEGDKKLKIMVLSRNYRLYFELKDVAKEWYGILSVCFFFFLVFFDDQHKKNFILF
jgi:tetratricopeptide (TPR) repeat protein